jgi:predicted restriction endonuclease
MCGLSCRALLIASHIVPWAARPELRLDPRNGLCLCALHDKAFDRGFVSVGEDFCIMIAERTCNEQPRNVVESMFVAVRGQPLRLTEKFRPSPVHIEFHRTTEFDGR